MDPLRALVAAGHEIALVVSQPDRRRGRGSALSPSPVKAAALELGLPVTDRVEEVLEVGAELGVVVAFGRLVRPNVLERLPLVNLHFSLLPRWRGAAPVERAILAGDEETGVCLMGLEEGLDTGPVFRRVSLSIGPEETAEELRARLVVIGTEALVSALASGLAGLGSPIPQEGEPTTAAKVTPEERRLDWSRPALHLHRVVRVGGAWTTIRGRRLHVRRARLSAEPGVTTPGAATPGPALRPGALVGSGPEVVCGDGGRLELVEVQAEGRAPQPAAAWLRGARLAPGEGLGDG